MINYLLYLYYVIRCKIAAKRRGILKYRISIGYNDNRPVWKQVKELYLALISKNYGEKCEEKL